MPMLQSAKETAEKNKVLKSGVGKVQHSNTPTERSDGGGAPAHKEAAKEEHKKKHKHPAAKPAPAAPAPSEAPDDSGDADATDQSAPDDQTAGASDEEGSSDAGSGAASGDEQQQGDEGQGGGDSPDQGQDDSDGGQQGQQGQGATPVPNPQAPGAGDDTSGGADTPAGEGDTGGGETPAGQAGNTPGQDSNTLPQVPMSPGLKDEYDRANTMLMQELYGSNDQAAQGIIQGLQADGPMKIRSAVHLALVVTTEIVKKLGAQDFPRQLVMPFTKDVVSHVMDLGQQVKQIQYSEQESVAILGATYEGIMRIFTINYGQAKQAHQLLGKKVLLHHMAQHKKALAFAKPGIDALNNAGGPQQGAPQTAGPQTGAPAGSQSAPQSGAPPQPPPPQGGPLAQAAAASPAAQGGGQ